MCAFVVRDIIGLYLYYDEWPVDSLKWPDQRIKHSLGLLLSLLFWLQRKIGSLSLSLYSILIISTLENT